MKSYLGDLPKPFIVLAPLYDVTDTVFRRIIADCARPDVFFTEFVNADGLQSAGRDKLIHRLKFIPSEKPIVAQIWGKNPENFQKTAKELVEMGFSGIDLNFGCPDKAVIKNGCCSALIKEPTKAQDIIQATQAGANGKVPVSVKTRIGFREFNSSWLETILNNKLNMLSVHLRTVKEMSKVPAHWELMTQIREMRDKLSPDTLLVGNGDVMSREEALEKARDHKIDGVMVGRGVFNDPFVFAEKSPWQEMTRDKKLEIYKNHVDLFIDTWQNNERPVVTLNKFCKIYVSGFDGARELREKLMHCKSIDELREKLRSI
jgi:tRNA-dihydrouridine synthase